MKCHICGCRVQVTKSGKLYKHRNPQPEKYWAYWCPGSGKPAQANSAGYCADALRADGWKKDGRLAQP
jgi:hypothetical protein